jgi:hypothetical protein
MKPSAVVPTTFGPFGIERETTTVRSRECLGYRLVRHSSGVLLHVPKRGDPLIVERGETSQPIGFKRCPAAGIIGPQLALRISKLGPFRVGHDEGSEQLGLIPVCCAQTVYHLPHRGLYSIVFGAPAV